MTPRKNGPPRHIIGYLKSPETWDALAFETAIRAEVENSTGPISASDEALIGMLLQQMETLLEAQKMVNSDGLTVDYNSGPAQSPWIKTRNDSTDKAIKILGELALVAKGRPKKQNKPTDVDELFATA